MISVLTSFLLCFEKERMDILMNETNWYDTPYSLDCTMKPKQTVKLEWFWKQKTNWTLLVELLCSWVSHAKTSWNHTSVVICFMKLLLHSNNCRWFEYHVEFFHSMTTVLKKCMQAFADTHTHTHTHTHRTSVMLHNLFQSCHNKEKISDPICKIKFIL
jgi:hypothetical protein